MKINRVFVSVPPLQGIMERPVINIHLEDELYSNTEPLLYYPRGVEWSSQKYGPFIKYSCEIKERESAGYYNVAFRDLVQPIADIKVWYGPLDAPVLHDGNFGLTVSRARQYLKFHDLAPRWRLLLNDADAQSGLVSWTPTERQQSCWSFKPLLPTVHSDIGYQRHSDASKPCLRPAANTVRIGDVDLPLCPDHLEDHNNNRRIMRMKSKG